MQLCFLSRPACWCLAADQWQSMFSALLSQRTTAFSYLFGMVGASHTELLRDNLAVNDMIGLCDVDPSSMLTWMRDAVARMPFKCLMLSSRCGSASTSETTAILV